MKLRVILDVFSGQPNPEWYIDGEVVEEIKEKLGDLPETTPIDYSKSGYRGFILYNENGDASFPEEVRVMDSVLVITNGEKTEFREDLNGIEILMAGMAVG